EPQKRAYILADNRLALSSGWDEQLLALELQYLSELELDFDLGAIGFETAEIDLLLSGLAGGAEPPTRCRQSMRRRHRSAAPTICGSVAVTACSAGTLRGQRPSPR